MDEIEEIYGHLSADIVKREGYVEHDAAEGDQSLEWLIQCLNSLPDHELSYVLVNLKKIATSSGRSKAAIHAKGAEND